MGSRIKHWPGPCAAAPRNQQRLGLNDRDGRVQRGCWESCTCRNHYAVLTCGGDSSERGQHVYGQRGCVWMWTLLLCSLYMMTTHNVHSIVPTIIVTTHHVVHLVSRSHVAPEPSHTHRRSFNLVLQCMYLRASSGATGGDGQSPPVAQACGNDDADMQHTSQYLGVSWSTEAQKWRVSVVGSPSRREGKGLM